MTYNYDILLKYIVLGDYATGKTSLLKRFTTDKFEGDYQPTLAVEFQHKLVQCEEFTLKIMMWDTAGQETFRSIVRSYYRNCIVAIVVFDLTNRKTFEHVQNWLEQVQKNCHSQVRKVIVGNKTDKITERVVYHQEAVRLADKYSAMYFQVSAASGDNVDNMLLQPAKSIIKDLQQKRLHVPADVDIGIKLSDRRPLPTASKLEINVNGQSKSKCEC